MKINSDWLWNTCIFIGENEGQTNKMAGFISILTKHPELKLKCIV